MKVKEKVIRESIARVERELAKVVAMLEANPMAGIVEVMREFNALLEGVSAMTSQEFMEKVNALAAREKKHRAAYEKQKKQSTNDLVTRRVELDFELMELKTELFHLERRQNP